MGVYTGLLNTSSLIKPFNQKEDAAQNLKKYQMYPNFSWLPALNETLPVSHDTQFANLITDNKLVDFQETINH